MGEMRTYERKKQASVGGPPHSSLEEKIKSFQSETVAVLSAAVSVIPFKKTKKNGAAKLIVMLVEICFTLHPSTIV